MKEEIVLEATINAWPYIGASFLILVFKAMGLFNLPLVWAFSPIALALFVLLVRLISSAFKK